MLAFALMVSAAVELAVLGALATTVLARGAEAAQMRLGGARLGRTQRRASDPALQGRLRQLQGWQASRLGLDYADQRARPRRRAAAQVGGAAAARGEGSRDA
ncbi:MAG: hypothetical protein MUF07_04400 [Steroidobacteraceae bacterium]|jgi:hypothetical protein|nr:hypothetical protein [Steroidobacteraceae bacterium]